MAEPTRGNGSAGTIAGNDDYNEAMKHVQDAWLAETENFDKGRDDQQFYAGEQWIPEARQDRENANRPIITINRIPGFVKQVTGDVRKDTPSIKVAPMKDGASEDIADIFNGLIRNIENNSNAKAAYVQGVENACVTGLGCFRVKTQYSDDSSFDQDIRIERIPDPFQVLFDPACRQPDKSDARYVALFVDMPMEVFRKTFPNASAVSMPTGPSGTTGLVWWTLDTVRVAEYWWKKPVKKLLLELADGRVIDSKEALRETKESGIALSVVQKREVDSFEVCMRLMSGAEFLTPETPWAGKYIPICPVIGEEIYVDGRVQRRGMVRDAKDAQRVYNYMRTAAVEAAALQPKMPWLVTVDMISGLEPHWKQLGSKNLPYAVYKPDPKAPGQKPERAQPALAQGGLDSQAHLSADDLQAVVGIYNVSLGGPSNETSGRAINARNAQADTGTFNYIDNLATAIRFCGKILVDLIPKIYDTHRIVRILKEDGAQEMAHVNMPVDGQGNPVDDAYAVSKLNDLTVGEYDVTVITGPSFATRRMEAQQSMTELLRSAPDITKVAGDLIVKNMDFPGAQEIAKRIERTIAPQILNDGPPQPIPPSPAELAKTNKDTAQAKLYNAQAEETEIKAVGEGVAVLQAIQGIGQNLMALKAQIDALGQPAPTAGVPPAPAAMPPQGPPQAPPSMIAPPDVSALGELEPLPQQ